MRKESWTLMSNEYDMLVQREARSRRKDKSGIATKMSMLWNKMTALAADEQDMSVEYPQRILAELRALYPG